MSPIDSTSRTAGHAVDCGCPDCRRSPRPSHYGLSKVFSKDLPSSEPPRPSYNDQIRNAEVSRAAKTNEEKILWWVRVIGVITLIGFFLGVFFGIKAGYEAHQTAQCLEEHSYVYCTD